MTPDSFAERFGFKSEGAPISVRDDAPEHFRHAIVLLGYENGLKPSSLRMAICEVLLKRPDPSNWSDYPNIEQEVNDLIESAPWFKVYDIAEKIFRELIDCDASGKASLDFERRLNGFMIETGIGWLMQNGLLVARGSESFSATTRVAVAEMQLSGRSTAATELHEALADISRRPDADVTGAIQHAMAALECVARDVANSTDTLGKIIPKLGLPKPMDLAVEKMWGFASERGRHIREGRDPRFEEAELIVTVASAVSIYLIRIQKTSE